MQKKALILDLDGTLYFQFGVRIIMGLWMLLYYIVHLLYDSTHPGIRVLKPDPKGLYYIRKYGGA